jgi:ABC-type amino acid transport substrate-binding protein
MKSSVGKSPLNFLIFKLFLAGFLITRVIASSAQDLADIQERGVLRHLGVPYARFVVDKDEGLDVEIIQRFAKHIGVRYEYVPTDWYNIFQDLIGHNLEYQPTLRALGSRPIRGDVIGSGLTILPGRDKVIDFSVPTFPTAVWLMARTASRVEPIRPSGNLATDIKATKAKLKLGTTFVIDNSCLDPKLYGLEGKHYRLKRFTRAINLNDIVPAVFKQESEMTLLDVPDILVALEKWPGQIKVIGPISGEQRMAAAFRKSSPLLRQAFNEFFVSLQEDGTYMGLVRKYYRSAPRYLPDYFRALPGGQ